MIKKHDQILYCEYEESNGDNSFHFALAFRLVETKAKYKSQIAKK